MTMTRTVATGLADESCVAHGSLAPLAARFLNRTNRGLIDRALDAMEVGPGHRVLDLGFGGAISLQLMLSRVGDGHVAGIDPSAAMVGRARRTFARELRAGRMALERATAEALPFDDGSFDAVLSTQRVFFWRDLRGGLEEARRVLAYGGRLAVAMMPHELQERLGFRERGHHVMSLEQLTEHMEAAGFTTGDPRPPLPWMVVGRKL